MSGLVLFIAMFVFMLFFTKLTGGLNKTNMLYFPHALTWKETFNEIDGIIFISLGCTVGFMLMIIKMKIF